MENENLVKYYTIRTIAVREKPGYFDKNLNEHTIIRKLPPWTILEIDIKKVKKVNGDLWFELPEGGYVPAKHLYK